MKVLTQGRALAYHQAFRPLQLCTRRYQLESRSVLKPHHGYSRLRIVQTFASAASTKAEESGYRMPPQEVLNIVDAPPEPFYSFSPSRKMVLQLARPPSNPPIAEFARPELKLAGTLHSTLAIWFIVGRTVMNCLVIS